MQPAANFERAANFVKSAAQQGCHLAVLPEYHLTNWLPNDPKFHALCADWRTYLQKYQDLARECNICIVPGTIVQTRGDAENDNSAKEQNAPSAAEPHDASAPPASDRNTSHPPPPNPAQPHAPSTNTGGTAPYLPSTLLENATYFISTTGAILGQYTKKNLWGPTERQHLTSSGRTSHPVIDTPLGKIGLLICWDLAFPEAFRELVMQGAKMVILPTFWTLSDASDAGLRHNPTAEALFVNSALVTRAFENTAAIVFANAGGPPGRGYAGLSQIVLPFVGPVVKLGGSGEGMGVAEIDMQVVEDAEDNYQVRADLAREGWHYDYREYDEVEKAPKGDGSGSKL